MSKVNKFTVQVTSDHLKRISNTNPLDAIFELIWNSIDAAATDVHLKINRNEAEGIDSISVIDNGHGISVSDIKNTFGKFGQSQKTTTVFNSRGKRFHGSLGEGRFKAYSLGNKIEWKSKDSSSGKLYLISGNTDAIGEYSYQELQDSKAKGTEFIAYNGFGEKLKVPSLEKIKEKAMTVFAPKILADQDLKIYIDGHKLDPNEFIDRDETIELDKKHNAKCRLVVWKSGSSSDLFWCEEDFIVKYEEKVDDIASHHGFSIFIESKDVKKAIQDGTIEVSDISGLGNLKLDSIEGVRKYLKEIDKKKVIETVKHLKDSDLYPFKGEPTGDLDRLERSVFDVCITKVVQAVPGIASGGKDKQKMTFHLLRTAIESSPNAVQHIFENIVQLPADQIEELSTIIKKFSITGLIRIGKIVSDRNSFISGLENILFEPKYKKHLLERTQLHKILEQESWLFGEEFSLGTSDESLDGVLEYHKKFLKQNSEEIEVPEGDSQGERVQIPDLVLGLQYKQGAADRYHHLVIELKRPSVKIGFDEKSQIEQYAAKVASDERFDKKKTRWTFILVSNSVDPQVEELADSDGRINPSSAKGNFEIYVRPWASITQSAKGRMQYLWDKAELKSSREDGREYLQKKFPDIINELDDSVKKSEKKKKSKKKSV